MRWASPPDNVPAFRLSERYSRPTSSINESRFWISRNAAPEISFSFGGNVSSNDKKNSAASSIVMALTSQIFFSSIFTDNAFVLRRLPSQDGQISSLNNSLVPSPVHAAQ